MNLKELCVALSVSEATGRNWIKSGRLIPDKLNGKKPEFTEETCKKLRKELQSSDVLKSRRNKKYVSGNHFYRSYIGERTPAVLAMEQLINQIIRRNKKISVDFIRVILAELSLRFLSVAYDERNPSCTESNPFGRAIPYKSVLSDFIQADDTGIKNEYTYPVKWVQELIRGISEDKIIKYVTEQAPFLTDEILPERGKDLLGLLYISLRNLGSRKASGAYYTPDAIVGELVAALQQQMPDMRNKKILDPCCGTGNFLLHLANCCEPENIYACDIDYTAIRIAKINLVLTCGFSYAKSFDKHIICEDYLLQKELPADIVVGNPPWGADFTAEQEREYNGSFSKNGKGKWEAYDLFVIKTLNLLPANGVMSFVLPEAILSVRTHNLVRKKILETSEIQQVSYLDNRFDKVWCPGIILQLKKTGFPGATDGIKVCGIVGEESFEIHTARNLSEDNFPLHMNDKEYALITKMESLPNLEFLKNRAEFALGIVTGNNKEFLSSVCENGMEPVYRGKDIQRYEIRPSDTYLRFDKKRFQQTAPETMYRAKEKLIYRFVASDLVVAYDDCGRLTLNSCNILIPRIPDLEMKYILALLNSSAVRFFLKKKYRSVKILRSHLEAIPLPVGDADTRKRMISLVDARLKCADEKRARELEDAIDEETEKLFGLTKEECRIIKTSL